MLVYFYTGETTEKRKGINRNNKVNASSVRVHHELLQQPIPSMCYVCFIVHKDRICLQLYSQEKLTALESRPEPSSVVPLPAEQNNPDEKGEISTTGFCMLLHCDKLNATYYTNRRSSL